MIGQYINENTSDYSYQQYGPNGGPSNRGFRFFADGVGSNFFKFRFIESFGIDTLNRKIFIPDNHNHRILAFEFGNENQFSSKNILLVKEYFLN